MSPIKYLQFFSLGETMSEITMLSTPASSRKVRFLIGEIYVL